MSIPILKIQGRAIDIIKTRFGLLAGGSALVKVVGGMMSTLVMMPFFVPYYVLVFIWTFGLASLFSAGEVSGGLIASLAVVFGIVFLLVIAGSLAGSAAPAPLYVGYLRMALAFEQGAEAALEWLFQAFKAFWKWVGAFLWVTLWITLWSLLFIVPGIIKALSYSMTLPLMAEHPDLSVRDAMKLSMRMTEGYKGDLFVAALLIYAWSLVGSLLLAFTILGPAVYMILWVTPLSVLMIAGIYRHVLDSALSRGIINEAELGPRSLEDGPALRGE